MKRILSRVGIGSARVDTVLPKTTLSAGESVDAEVRVEGGSAEQEVDAIYFALLTRYETDDSVRTGVIDKFHVADPFTIGPDEERTFHVTIDVPLDTPITAGRTDVWLETGLDIDWSVDPDDRDPIQVEPGPKLGAFMDALDSLGFRLRKAQCEQAPGSIFAGRFVQELEFVPHAGPFAGKLDELEVVATETETGLDVKLEIDRRGGLLSEMADIDERWSQLSFANEGAREMETKLCSEIERHA
ncbi:sporulation protein [Haladaptatus sp. DYF46]|uniref:sporulation protein n=1 Tax=Haladaptatus sp. DYF46 TaxID=2886041 RepID=UPI001E5CF05E|nr:sporulation protein [Haladaptatus sp. DYF46]